MITIYSIQMKLGNVIYGQAVKHIYFVVSWCFSS